MIQSYLKDRLHSAFKDELPDVTWTIDNYYAEDNTVSIYYAPGRVPDVYDTEYRYPGYQVWIRSKDWNYAKLIAELVYEHLNKLRNLTVEIDYKKEKVVKLTKKYHVFFIEASSDIIQIGINDDGLMEYSLNFDVTLTEKKQQELL